MALPNQHDLTNDLVAALEGGGVLEAVCLELEAEARADAVTRSLEYQTRLWTEPAGPGSLKVSCVFGAVLDLTGRSPTRELSLRSELAPGCGLKLTVLRRHLADEKAANLVADVAAGRISPWLLPWVPLMAGGGESGIIAQWLQEAERRLTVERDRADLGSLTRVFAALAGFGIYVRAFDSDIPGVPDEYGITGSSTTPFPTCPALAQFGLFPLQSGNITIRQGT